jgi:hypothetical protein
MMKSYCSSHCVEQTRSFHHESDFPAPYPLKLSFDIATESIFSAFVLGLLIE